MNRSSWDLFDVWMTSLRARECTAKTLTAYRWTGTTFLRWCDTQALDLPDVRHGHIVDWLASRQIGAKTRSVYISNLASFFTWLEREEHLPSNPTTRVERPKVGKYLPRPAATEQIHAVLDQCDPRVGAMIACGAYAGMRRFEIAKLRGEDIDLTVIPPVVTVRGKGSVDRRVPLNGTVRAALERHGLPLSGWVFPSNRGGPITAEHCGRLIADALSSSSGRVTAHQLRHWFGSTLYQGSGDIRMVQELLGHQSIATTQIYCAWDPGRAFPAIAALPTPPAA